MSNYGYVIFFSLVGGVFSLLGGILLLSHKKTASALTRYATPFAGGALLAAVFLDLLKDGIEESSADIVLAATLVGVIAFFIAEGFLSWFQHSHSKEQRGDTTVPLIIIGDTIHNALDGVAIAAAFLVSVPAGIVTTFAVAAHEIPQEIGDFGLLLSRGMSRRKVIFINVMSALATTVMAVVTYALGSEEKIPTGLLLGISAGFLLYIATSDIIPTIHRQRRKGHRPFDLQAILLVMGALTVALTIELAHLLVS